MMVLVLYDVADPKRLKRVAALLESWGERVQRSVFECSVRARDLDRLVLGLKAVVKPGKDKVHVFPLCSTCRDRAGGPVEADVYII